MAWHFSGRGQIGHGRPTALIYTNDAADQKIIQFLACRLWWKTNVTDALRDMPIVEMELHEKSNYDVFPILVSYQGFHRQEQWLVFGYSGNVLIPLSPGARLEVTVAINGNMSPDAFAHLFVSG